MDGGIPTATARTRQATSNSASSRGAIGRYFRKSGAWVSYGVETRGFRSRVGGSVCSVGVT